MAPAAGVGRVTGDVGDVEGVGGERGVAGAETQIRTIATPTHGRFLLRRPAGPATLLLVGFHGYRENATRHLAELERIPGAQSWALLAVDALHAFYAGSTGEVLRVRAAMKPISTVPRALRTVDVATGEAARAINQRSDVCAVPAAAVVAEAMVALVLADALLEKFGGDSVAETARNLRSFRDHLTVR